MEIYYLIDNGIVVSDYWKKEIRIRWNGSIIEINGVSNEVHFMYIKKYFVLIN